MARPTKYLKRYCEDVIEWGKKGMSLHEMALKMGINYSTLNDWKKNKKEFSESVKRAVEFSQGWWEKLGKEGAAGLRDIQPTTYILNMKNRFKQDWRDKQEIETNTVLKPAKEMTLLELEQALKNASVK